MKYISFPFALIISFLYIPLTLGTTFEPLDFSELMARTELAVEVTVIDLQTVEEGVAQPVASAKNSVPPQEEVNTDQQEDVEIVADSANEEDFASSAPQSLPVEGGRMLYTDVTFAVDLEVFGIAGSDTLTIRVAGGTDGEVRVVIAGLPQFELNGRYLLFLKKDFGLYADPITGVNQGFFEIVTSPANGQNILLNANGDIVTGVQDDHILVSRNAEQSIQPSPRLGPPPKPESGVVTVAVTSPQVTAYWDSQAPAMPVDEFIAAAQVTKEGLQ